MVKIHGFVQFITSYTGRMKNMKFNMKDEMSHLSIGDKCTFKENRKSMANVTTVILKYTKTPNFLVSFRTQKSFYTTYVHYHNRAINTAKYRISHPFSQNEPVSSSSKISKSKTTLKCCYGLYDIHNLTSMHLIFFYLENIQSIILGDSKLVMVWIITLQMASYKWLQF